MYIWHLWFIFGLNVGVGRPASRWSGWCESWAAANLGPGLIRASAFNSHTGKAISSRDSSRVSTPQTCTYTCSNASIQPIMFIFLLHFLTRTDTHTHTHTHTHTQWESICWGSSWKVFPSVWSPGGLTALYKTPLLKISNLPSKTVNTPIWTNRMCI